MRQVQSMWLAQEVTACLGRLLCLRVEFVKTGTVSLGRCADESAETQGPQVTMRAFESPIQVHLSARLDATPAVHASWILPWAGGVQATVAALG